METRLVFAWMQVTLTSLAKYWTLLYPRKSSSLVSSPVHWRTCVFKMQRYLRAWCVVPSVYCLVILKPRPDTLKVHLFDHPRWRINCSICGDSPLSFRFVSLCIISHLIHHASLERHCLNVLKEPLRNSMNHNICTIHQLAQYCASLIHNKTFVEEVCAADWIHCLGSHSVDRIAPSGRK